MAVLELPPTIPTRQPICYHDINYCLRQKFTQIYAAKKKMLKTQPVNHLYSITIDEMNLISIYKQLQ